MISQKGICKQGHNLHYKEFVFPRKHASVSHFGLIGLQICCSGFFFFCDKSILGLLPVTCPKTNRSEKFKSHVLLSFQKIPLLSRVHDGVYQINVHLHPGKKTRTHKTTHSFLHNLSFQPLLEIEPVDASMHLFRRVEPQFMICSRRSMLNNLFLNSFTTQPAGH